MMHHARIRRVSSPAGPRFPALAAAIGLAMSAIAATATADPSADLVLLHGKIHTQDSHRTVVEAMERPSPAAKRVVDRR